MKILDRYIGWQIVFSSATVLGILISLFTFFTFADELGDTGKGNYAAGDALMYALSNIPGMAYELFPAAALIGTMMGLGMLAGNSELTAMRAAGYSMWALIRAVIKVGLIMMLLAFVLGEWVAPVSERYGETMRSMALSERVSLQTETGLWVRDGNKVINIGVMHSGGRVGLVNIYEIGKNNELAKVSRAKNATYNEDGDYWQLDTLETSYLSSEGVRMEVEENTRMSSLLTPGLMNVVTISPRSMSIMALSQYVNYLNDNGLDSSEYRQAMWSKIITPFATLTMVLLAVPFIFGSQRTMAAGHRILIGTMVGIGFHLLSQIFGYVGLVFSLNPVAAAVTPTAVFFIAALYLLRRVR